MDSEQDSDDTFLEGYDLEPPLHHDEDHEFDGILEKEGYDLDKPPDDHFDNDHDDDDNDGDDNDGDDDDDNDDDDDDDDNDGDDDDGDDDDNDVDDDDDDLDLSDDDPQLLVGWKGNHVEVWLKVQPRT